MSLIRIERLSKTYITGKIKTPALREVNLTIEEGEFICIAGPSGSGKTTLLNIIGTLDTPTSGNVFYRDKNLFSFNSSKLAEFRLKKVGFIFQAYNLIPTLTVLENTEYVMLLQGVKKDIRQEKAKKILKELGLENLMDKRPSQLSGGEQQRVTVARAIVSDPEIVLADEPTANLDSQNSLHLIKLMRKLNIEKKITFVFSTHDELVMREADKVYFLRDGKIEEEKKRLS
ncbi:MAG: macrolide ABC transporter ATP-binding protein [Candidatus Omnitrophica bacterium 4484_70.2]|nr:MAG: macrolide ABC transporter ATP-binding protein [Candidatus Omnitrophica bacterium 4484_70.2]